jgi:hypothetical protein
MEDKMDVKRELDIIRKNLKKDAGYFCSWRSNIAMSFYDEAKRNKVRVNSKKLHEISNTAAINFLNLLIRGN